MAGTKNLKPVSQLPRDEFIAAARKGGIKSGETRRRKKEMRDLILDILGKKIKKGKIDDFDVDSIEELQGKNITIAEKMVLAQVIKALEGDSEAFKVVRDTAGQKPTEKVSVKQESSVHKDLIQNLEQRNVEGIDD